MQDLLFIERSRLGKTFYELTGHQLRVSGTRSLKKFRGEYDLRDFGPHFERLSWRENKIIVTSLAIGYSMVLATRSLLMQKTLPFGAVLYFAEVTAIAAVLCLWTAARYIAPIEIVRFRNKAGMVMFDVVKERKQSLEFEEFVKRLRESIETMNQPDQPSEPARGTAP